MKEILVLADQVDRERAAPDTHQEASKESSMTETARLSRTRRYLLAGVAVTAVAVGGALPASAATASSPAQSAPTSTTQIQTATAASPNATSERFAVTRAGLFVQKATLTNVAGSAAKPTITNSGNGAVHVGSAIAAGQSFVVGFNRDVANGDVICGQLAGLPRLCDVITP